MDVITMALITGMSHELRHLITSVGQQELTQVRRMRLLIEIA
jgi:hypothetical protein